MKDLRSSVSSLQWSLGSMAVYLLIFSIIVTTLGVLGTIAFAQTRNPDETSDSTSGLSCDGGVVAVSTSTCPSDGQILIATSNVTAEWTTFANGSTSADDLVCASGAVVISGATCPVAGQVLTAIDNETAEWADPVNMTTTDELTCVGGTIVVSSATCPAAGQVLTAIDNTTAEWATPGNMTTSDDLTCVGGIIAISGATCPTAGQVLTAIDNATAEWSTPGNMTTSDDLTCVGGIIAISGATCPIAGQVLTAIDNATAEWSTPGNVSFVGELECVGGSVAVSGATCPTAGQVLTAIDNATAEWATVLTLASGTYTPVPTSTVWNITDADVLGSYMRIGTQVSVYIVATVQGTISNSSSLFIEFSLPPIPTTDTLFTHIPGIATATSIVSPPQPSYAYATGGQVFVIDTMTIRFALIDTNGERTGTTDDAHSIVGSFMYSA